MADDVMLNEALDAIHNGQRVRARDLLTRLLRTNQSNPDYWIWMSSVVDSATEQIYCLESALKADPANETAMRGLILLGARRPTGEVIPVPPVKRKWGVYLEEETLEPPTGWKKMWSTPRRRIFSISALAILLLSFGFFGIPVIKSIFGTPIAAAPSNTAIRVYSTFPNTFTPRPTNTLVVRSPTPTFIGPTPLWMYLDATYTPTPIYVNTPHTLSEAYRAGMRAGSRGDYKSMLSFMQEASQVDPAAADTRYYMGEAYRMMGDLQNALDAYDQAIKVNPSFAPAYLGRARVQSLLNPKIDVEKDYQKAIELDPNLAEAYLEHAGYLIENQDPETALEDLAAVEQIAPYAPLLYVYRAQAYLQLGETDKALENAKQGLEMDMTLLPAYLTLGQVYIASGDIDQAILKLKTYVLYNEEDSHAQALLGYAYYQQGKDYNSALNALNIAIELDEENGEAYYYRGMIYIAQKEGQKAVNDIYLALKQDSKSFQYNMGLGQALLAAGRSEDAYRQFRSSETLAEDDEQMAQVLYWRALALEALGNPKAAIIDWEALLALPEEAVSAELKNTAEEHLLKLNPPTSTPTPKPTSTQTATPTPKPTNTPTKTVTPKPTSTSTASRTPSATPKPSLTPTRTGTRPAGTSPTQSTPKP